MKLAPSLSPLDQGIFDRPSVPLLFWNGLNASVCPVADLESLRRHGSPKTTRVTDGGPSGYTAETDQAIAASVARRLGQRFR